MPRSLHGFRNLAVSNPSIFFSNPYLSSLYPMMSPGRSWIIEYLLISIFEFFFKSSSSNREGRIKIFNNAWSWSHIRTES